MFSHYWTPAAFSTDQWAVVRDLAMIVLIRSEVDWRSPFSEDACPPVLDDHVIALKPNAAGYTRSPFVLSRNIGPLDPPGDLKCTTSTTGYDTWVTAILFLAAETNPAFSFRSDTGRTAAGPTTDTFERGWDLASELLGRPIEVAPGKGWKLDAASFRHAAAQRERNAIAQMTSRQVTTRPPPRSRNL